MSNPPWAGTWTPSMASAVQLKTKHPMQNPQLLLDQPIFQTANHEQSGCSQGWLAARHEMSGFYRDSLLKPYKLAVLGSCA